MNGLLYILNLPVGMNATNQAVLTHAAADYFYNKFSVLLNVGTLLHTCCFWK